MSAKQELTAGPAKLHSQIFYYTTGGFINNNIHTLNRRSLQLACFPSPGGMSLTFFYSV